MGEVTEEAVMVSELELIRGNNDLAAIPCAGATTNDQLVISLLLYPCHLSRSCQFEGSSHQVAYASAYFLEPDPDFFIIKIELYFTSFVGYFNSSHCFLFLK